MFVKKCITIVLIINLIMVMQSFSSIVSDNDGSAFVTKAEFDALQSNFHSQIDSYNKSIDGKIDGAIATYLAGISLASTEQVSLPYANWKTVTCMNYALKNTFKFVDINIIYSMAGRQKVYDADAYQTWWAYLNAKYIRPAGVHQERLLCEAGSESGTFPSTITWLGRSTDYKESIDVSFQYKNTNTSRTGGFLSVADTGKMYGTNITDFKEGYFSDLNSAGKSFCGVRLYYVDTKNALNNGYRTESSKYSTTVSSDIVLNEVYNAVTDEMEKIKYEHIINYGKYNYEKFSDVDWKNTFHFNDDVSVNKEKLKQAATITSKWAAYTQNNVESSTYGSSVTNFSNNYSGNYGSASTENMVSIGLIDKTYDSDSIKQTKERFKVDNGKNTYESELLNLYNGFIVLADDEDVNVIWEPKFTNTQAGSTITSIAPTSFELNVELAFMPFGEEQFISDSDKIIKSKGQIENYQTTHSGTCRFDFVMPKDGGIVYCKWWPSDTDILSKKWSADLDLTKCGTYTRIVED